MYYLRTLSFHDVVRAFQHGEPLLALRIGQNLCSNAVNAVGFRLRIRTRPSSRRSA